MFPLMSPLTGVKAAEPKTSVQCLDQWPITTRRACPAQHTEQCGQALSSIEELSGVDGIAIAGINANVVERRLCSIKVSSHDG